MEFLCSVRRGLNDEVGEMIESVIYTDILFSMCEEMGSVCVQNSSELEKKRTFFPSVICALTVNAPQYPIHHLLKILFSFCMLFLLCYCTYPLVIWY